MEIIREDVNKELNDAFAELHKELGIKCGLVGDIEVSNVGNKDEVGKL